MRVKYEKTGSDIIPNKGFWFSLPSLVKVRNLISCVCVCVCVCVCDLQFFRNSHLPYGMPHRKVYFVPYFYCTTIVVWVYFVLSFVCSMPYYICVLSYVSYKGDTVHGKILVKVCMPNF